MFFNRFAENYYIIYIYFNKRLINTQNNIYFSLYIRQRIFEVYYRDIKWFLIFVRHYCKFVTICYFY